MSTTDTQQSLVHALDSTETADLAARRQAFRKLHESGCFVMPNPWDIGSARYLQHLGFSALATTSAGFAFSQGLPDSQHALSLDQNLRHIGEIASAIDVPLNADFASGYATAPEDVAANVTRCVATGVAGLSVEDASGEPDSPLYDLPLAVERIRAARHAIDQAGSDVVLTARAECYLVGHPDPLTESIRRLQAYAEAGADVLFAPGLHDGSEIKALVEAAQPKPVNLLVARDTRLSVAGVAALGVRRISVGPALALAAWTGLTRAAQILKSEGSFAGLANVAPYAEINRFLATDYHARHAHRR